MSSDQDQFQYHDRRRQGVDDVPADAHPTPGTPLHAEPRPAFGPFMITVGLLVIILVVMLVVFLL
jgi:hypothetical protein